MEVPDQSTNEGWGLKKKATSSLLAAAVLASALGWPAQVVAHWDAPGPPPLRRLRIC